MQNGTTYQPFWLEQNFTKVSYDSLMSYFVVEILFCLKVFARGKLLV